MQRGDFEAMYKELKGLPMTVRFLDPPLHEFVPTNPDDIAALAKQMNLPVDELTATIGSLHEFNPMMGHRGCRLGGYLSGNCERCRRRAVIEAAIEVSSRTSAAMISFPRS